MDPGIAQFIPLILIFVIFYFFLIRPQQRKAKEHKKMVEELKRGDKVLTTGGIIGTIERIIDNEKVEVEIADNIKVEVLRSSGIQSLINNNIDESEKQTQNKEVIIKSKNLKTNGINKLPLPSRSIISTSEFKVPSRGYVKLNGPKITFNLQKVDSIETL